MNLKNALKMTNKKCIYKIYYIKYFKKDIRAHFIDVYFCRYEKLFIKKINQFYFLTDK